MATSKKIRFIENQNHKIFCDYFTTIRKANDYWEKDSEYWVEYVSPQRQMFTFKVKLIGIRKLKEVKDEWIMIQDTGRLDWVEYLKSIYKDFNIDDMVILLFQRLKKQSDDIQK